MPVLHAELSIIVNGRDPSHERPVSELRDAARTRGGALIRGERSGAVFD